MVPMIAFHYFDAKGIRIKKGFENLPAWFKVLVQYCIIVVFNIPITRVLTFLIKTGTGISIEVDSSYYTIVAIIAAFVMPGVYNCAKSVIGRVTKK